MATKPCIVVKTIAGLGDSIHARAVVREKMKTHEVWVQTSWPNTFHDLDVKIRMARTSVLPAKKNYRREKRRIESRPVPRHAKSIVAHYPEVKTSVLAAMSDECDEPVGDFSMTVPNDWRPNVVTDKPILFYRPLLERPDRSCNKKRNADPVAYKAIFDSIRIGFHVVSIADLSNEHIVSEPIDADSEFYKGELTERELFGLMDMADLAFTGSGFAVPMAQSVGTPVISIFGGFEHSRSFEGTSKTPYLGIDPINVCSCLDFDCPNNCKDNPIDIDAATRSARQFVESLGIF